MSAPYHLVIRLTAIGDVLLSLPAIAALRGAAPGTRIAYLTDPAQAPLLEGQPGIDTVFTWPRGPEGKAVGVSEVFGTLKDEAFTSVIDLQHKVRTRRLARALSRAREIPSLALRRRTAGQALLALFGHDPPRRGPHATRLFFEALSGLGIKPPVGDGPLAYRWEIPKQARARLQAFALPPRPRIGLAPSTRWPTKNWPEAKFAKLAARLVFEGHSLVLVGGPEDREVHQRLMADLPPRSVVSTADVDLLTLGALLSRLEALVTGDSGPAHLAAAVGCPLVSLFGPTPPERWAPGRGPRIHLLHLGLPCQPCSNHGTMRCPLDHHECMKGLEVDAVHSALMAAIRSGEDA